MIRDKDIKAYFRADFVDLRANQKLPIDIFLYFKQNAHLLVWMSAGSRPDAQLLRKYEQRGLEHIWIHKDDRKAWKAYLKAPDETPSLRAEDDATSAEKSPDFPEVPGFATNTDDADDAPDAENAPEFHGESAAEARPPEDEQPAESVPVADGSESPGATAHAEAAGQDAQAEIEDLATPLNKDQPAEKAKTQTPDSLGAESTNDAAANPDPELSPGTLPSERAYSGTQKDQQQARAVRAQKILALLRSKETDPQKKAAAVADEARDVLKEALSNEQASKQEALNAEARDIAREILKELRAGANSEIAKIWEVADLDLGFTHSVNVATYAVMLALAFGKIDQTVLGELALSGLVHDIGVSQISTVISQKAWTEFQEADRAQYRGHVQAGLNLLQRYAPLTPAKTLEMVGAHHEKFNGQGYPAQIEGFKLDSIGQILSVAEMLDTLASGQFDGKTRGYGQALRDLEKLESDRNFPEYFNPEIFATVLKWAQSKDAFRSSKEALSLVKNRSSEVLQEKKAA